MIITIDGPSGAGKSSAARSLAKRLGFEYLDTGAMYRAVALGLIRDGIAVDDGSRLQAWLAGTRIELPPGFVRLNGEDVTSAIRSSEVTAASGPVADSLVVRRFLADQQRTLAEGRNMVCEGRDQGTIVFPDAACKFFLIADPTERARRRQRELAARGETVTVDQVLAAQEARDRRDEARAIAPMKPAADAIPVDSTRLNLDQVVDLMELAVRQAGR